MSSVYSTCLIDVPVATGSEAFYSVPEDVRCVVRSLTVAHYSPGSEGQWYLAAGEGSYIVAGWWQGLDQTECYTWSGHHVVNPGGGIVLYTGQPCSVRVSGYLLTLP